MLGARTFLVIKISLYVSYIKFVIFNQNSELTFMLCDILIKKYAKSKMNDLTIRHLNFCVCFNCTNILFKSNVLMLNNIDQMHVR